MYLLTAHRTILGIDADTKLVQLRPIEENLSRFFHFGELEEGDVLKTRPLAGFCVEKSEDGISFVSNKKYLCALNDSATFVADRDKRNRWEIFGIIPDIKMSEFLKNKIYTGSVEEAARFGREVLKLRAEGKPVKIYCGAGTVPIEGFLNLDFQILAPTNFAINKFEEYFIFPFVEEPWDLPDNCVDYIFHEDFIEHITQLQQFQFLAETLRVLKPGCWHRVNTPNVLTAMKIHSNFKKGFRGVYTGETQYGHIYILSPNSLKEMAELVGYREVVFTTRHQGVSPYATKDRRPGPDRDDVLGNIYADLLK
jgi:hypothetical protein